MSSDANLDGVCDLASTPAPNPLIPVYVSLTSIYQNQSELSDTLESLICQSMQPSMIYLYLSETHHLQDIGFENRRITNAKLAQVLDANTDIIRLSWVENEGSYRKLLPLLREKWVEDCIIITVDDDTVYTKDLIENMVADYNFHGCVINYRGFTPQMSHLGEFAYEMRGAHISKHLYNFPTGKSGILYKPSFFHSTGDLIFRKDIYMSTCPTGDDVWFYLVRIKNNVLCYLGNKKYMDKDNTTRFGLYKNYNSHNSRNTKQLLATLGRLWPQQ
jgi:hypothetical protein